METRDMGFKFKLSILLAIFLQFLINLNLFRIQESGFGENPDFAELKCGFFSVPKTIAEKTSLLSGWSQNTDV